MIDLEPIKARLAAATPGPWETYKPRINTAVITTDENQYITAYVAERVRETADAEFIAFAPTDIAALVEEVERLCLALDTVGSTIYTQGRGTKTEQSLLMFIRKELGRI